MDFFRVTNLDNYAVKLRGMAIVLKDDGNVHMASELEKMAMLLTDSSNELKAEYALRLEEKKDDKT